MIADGLKGLNDALSTGKLKLEYTTVHKILGEGNFVLSVTEGKLNDKPTSFYDLFRLKDGKIVEHWDVIQDIPVKQANSNGMFGGLN